MGTKILNMSDTIKIIDVSRNAKKTKEMYMNILSCMFFQDLIEMYRKNSASTNSMPAIISDTMLE